MNRRDFTTGLAVTAVATRLAASQSPSPSLTFDSSPLAPPIPADFFGLSYESAQLENPDFFSPANADLINLFRDLAPSGNLRIGGGSSEFTTFSNIEKNASPSFEIFGPDTSRTVKSGTTTTIPALQNLRGFLEAVNWSCLYGLNLGQGTVENATREAAAVQRILGPRLLAFQIGNEPDSFRNRYRPATYTPDDYLAEWNRFHTGIVAVVPEARFAGPDISNKLAYLTAFATSAPQHPDIILLTSHYYAMGPAGNPDATLDNLLDPNPKLTTLKHHDLHIIEEARELAHLPYRMSEGNSCWNGGQAGVSDVFASALWASDYALSCAARGWAGINFHGGGNGIYSPIVGAPSTGFLRRPEFFGIQFAARFLGARVRTATLADASPRVAAYILETSSGRDLVLINKTPTSIIVTLPSRTKASAQLRLHAPSIDATTNIQLTTIKESAASTASAPAYTATLFHLHGQPRTRRPA
jgi:hypothetical protein